MSERQSVPGSAEERFEPVQEAFRELNEFLADTVSAYEYDVAAGLERLKVGLATDGAEQPAECRISIDSLGLQITEYLITSLSSPEFAEFIPSRQGGSWLLSWLPDRPLTRDQAISGMAIDQVLSDPKLAYDAGLVSWVDELVVDLDLTLEQAVCALAKRVEARLLDCLMRINYGSA